MKIVDSFPHAVHEIEHTGIPLSDGCRLAARIWLPVGAGQSPVPAILEYVPYRKNDLTAKRDARIHPYFAGHGYASVRVDLRGSGDSEGVLTDEYLQQELDDGVEVLRWIAAQAWCNGRVGMMGISWGGFNALQVAALAPAELGAVITVCSTDDRFADDVHYMGGCLLVDNLSWASVMFALNTLPPDPRHVGERWRELWMQRLHGSGLWLENWLRHPHRDDYWKHGSVCEDLSAIRCPVYAVGGWADGYCNAVFRLLAGLQVPRKGLIGPWNHGYPHAATPGPAIGFLQEALRWWDHWLKGEETGVMDEPMLRVWMQDPVPPRSSYDVRPGRWVCEPCWPTDNVHMDEYALSGARTLVRAEQAGSEVPMSVSSPLGVGFHGGKWCPYGRPPDLPSDQTADDGGSLTFDSAPLEEGLEILGSPEVELVLSADKPVALVAVRLSDLAPDGRATRVTYGLLNLTHRDSHAHPEPLDPGRRYRVRVPLKHVAQRFAAGHRIRFSISSSYWPVAWPPPEAPAVTVYAGVSRLRLPLRTARAEDAMLAPFDEPEGAPRLQTTVLEAPRSEWKVVHDLARDKHALVVLDDGGTYRIDAVDLTITMRGKERYSHHGGDYESVRGETYWVLEIRRDAWSVRTETRTVMTSDPERFQVHAELEAFEGDRRVHRQSWDREIPRKVV